MRKNEPKNQELSDSIIWMRNLYAMRSHYFDYIDFNDDRLLYTPLIDKKLDHFFNRVVPENSDSINYYMDKVLTLAFLQKKYNANSDYEYWPVYVHLIKENKDSFSPKEYREAESYEKLIPGKIFPDIQIVNKNDNQILLSDIDAEYLIVYFFEPDCHYCAEATHMLTLITGNHSKKIKVLALYTGLSAAAFKTYATMADNPV